MSAGNEIKLPPPATELITPAIIAATNNPTSPMMMSIPTSDAPNSNFQNLFSWNIINLADSGK